MAENIKNSSMKQAPKGRIPAIIVQTTGCMYQTWTISLTTYNLPQLYHLSWDLSWNLVGADRMFIRLLSVSKEIPEENKRQWDSKPHGHNSENSEEGNGSTGVFAPDEEVDEESNSKHNGGIQSCCEKRRSLPLFTLHGSVESAWVVTCDHSQELVEEDGSCEESSSGGWTQHSQHGEEYCDGQHGEDLNSASNDSSEQFVMKWRSKHISAINID